KQRSSLEALAARQANGRQRAEQRGDRCRDGGDTQTHPGRIQHGAVIEEFGVPAQRPAAPHRHQPRGVEGVDDEDDDRQVQKPQPKRQRGDVEPRYPVDLVRHQPAPPSVRRCSRSYSNSGGTSSNSSATAAAGAPGQSLLVKNSSHSVCPIIIEPEPARRSGMTNSPTIGMKHNSAPAPTPGSDSGNVTIQNASRGEAPRSLAASISEPSIFASVA